MYDDLEAALMHAGAQINALQTAERKMIDSLLFLLPGAYYMDPPDGGSVTMLEQLKRMAKDSERYRWLRSQNWNTGLLAVVADPKSAIKLGYDAPSLARLDEAIDAAMVAEKVFRAA